MPKPKKEYVTVPFEVKGIEESKRQFEGYSATWDLDLGNDVIHKGAFARTISRFKQGQKSIALLDSHNYDSVLHGYGDLLDAEEDDRGVWSKWQVIDGADGERIIDRLRGKVIRKKSIGYMPLVYDFERKQSEEGDTVIRHLRELSWEETSLVLFPMNPAANIDLNSVKYMLTKARQGELPTGDIEELKQLHNELGAALTDPDPPAPQGIAPEQMDALNQRILALKIRQRLATRDCGSALVGM